MYSDVPGPIWIGPDPGRYEDSRGRFYSPRALRAVEEARDRWNRTDGGGYWLHDLYAFAAGALPLTPGGFGIGGGPGLPGDGTYDESGGGTVNTLTGNLLKSCPIVNWAARGPDIALTLYHNSRSDYDYELGPQWSCNYGAKLDVQNVGGAETVTIRWGDGTIVVYNETGVGTNVFTRPSGIFDDVTRLAGGLGYRVTTHDQTTIDFSYPDIANNQPGHMVAIADRDGNHVTIELETVQTYVKRIKRVIDSTGRAIVFGYNIFGDIETVTDPISRVWTIHYTSGLLSSIDYPLLDGVQRTRYYDYNIYGQITSETDLRGKVWRYDYYPDKKVKWSKDPLLHQTTYIYNLSSCSIVHPDSKTTVHNYSGGLLASEVDEAGFSVSYKTYSNRLPTLIRDARGQYWSFTYDANGNTLSETNPFNKSWTYGYTSTNELDWAKTPVHGVNDKWDYTYYADGKLKELFDPEGRRIQYRHYDSYGQIDWSKDAGDNATYYGHDVNGNLDSITTPSGPGTAPSGQTTAHYDTVSRMDWIEDGTGNTTDIEVDSWSRRKLVRYPACDYPYEQPPVYGVRHTKQIAYDYEGHVTAVTDERGKQTQFQYDDAGRLTFATNANNEVEEYGYNSRDWVTSIENGRHYTRTYSYTDRGEPYILTMPDSTGEAWTYDANGNLTEHRYELFGVFPQEELKKYVYDNASRMTDVDYLGSMTNSHFGYDDADRLTSMTDTSGSSTWEYFKDDQIKKLISPQGTMRYDYDTNARLYHIYEELPPSPDLVTTYGYDNSSRVVSIAKFGETTSFEHDAADRLTKQTYANGAYAAYGYDPRSRITSTIHKAAAGTPELAREENWYDPASRITRRVSGGVTTTFGYDDVGQILSESDSGGYSAAYTYDANGNRLTKTTGGVTQTCATDSGDKLTGITYSDSTPAKTFTYHFSGRCTGFTQGAITRTYTWDKECRITGVSETGQASVSYGYNGFDARATRTLGGATTTVKRDGADPVDAVLSDISGATTARYLPGISEQRNGVSTYFHDGIKNAITQTNASQSVTATKRYDAFGLEVASTGTWKSPFAYGGPWGYQEDGDAYGLKLLGHRYYDPSLGRFLSRDIARDGRNWYAYCECNPLRLIDYDGLKIRMVGFSASQEAKVRKHLKLIERCTIAGRQLIYELTHDKDDHIISPPNQPGDPHYNPSTGRVRYDPNEAILLPSQGAKHRAIPCPPDTVLMHELGHMYGRPDPGNGTAGARARPGDTVYDFENPHRKVRGLKARFYY
ncbi:MAG TPA: RHS repeat-associated core domain-containing protein [Fimbriimonadales bacterium]|nr:RHS repeat-associated core domain-containing protein [Fimbriimonadales bacterium]